MRYYLDDGAFDLVRAHETDAGMDVRSPIDIVIPAHEFVGIKSGVHIEVHDGAGIIFPKSGLMWNRGILTFGCIDEGYSGEVGVVVFNFGHEDFHVHRGDKITQILDAVVRYGSPEKVAKDEFVGGVRGDNGFGSTGV